MKALAPIAALLLSVAILLTGQGLQFALLPVRAAYESFPTVAIGIMGAAYFSGFTIGCLGGGGLVRRVGHVRVFLAMTAIASVSPLIHALAIQPVIWTLFRMLTGFCFATLYIVIESWLNAYANNSNRGLIFSTYSMVTLIVMAVGQMSLVLYDPSGAELFIIASVLVSIAAVPIALSTSPSPQPPTRVSIDLPRLFEISPSGLVGSLVTGLVNGSFWALAPVFGNRIGGVSAVALFMTAVVIGGAAAQWPLGILSDRLGRRKILVAIALTGCLIGSVLAMSASAVNLTTASVLGFLWGAVAFPLSSVSVAYANDYAQPGEHVTVSSSLLFTHGIGATIGPLIGSALMGDAGTGILFGYAAAVHFALAAFVVLRYLREPRVAEEPVAFADALTTTQTASQIYDAELERAKTESPDSTAGGRGDNST